MLFNKFSERIKAASGGGGIAGIPGGSTGQVLVKASGTDYDYVWNTIPGTFTISEGNYIYFAYVVDDIQINVEEMTNTSGGVVPVPPDDATYYLNGTGAWSIPPGTGSGTVPAGGLTGQVLTKYSDADGAYGWDDGPSNARYMPMPDPYASSGGSAISSSSSTASSIIENFEFGR